jgi:Golgi nucleoside diphosphatase
MSITVLILALVPSALIGVAVVLIVRWFLKSIDLQIRAMSTHDQKRQMIALRTQALERLTILLERIKPQSLVIREQHHDMNSQQFHSHLLKVIRQEFEHNLAMQIYLSGDVWVSVIQAKDETIKLINSCASKTNPSHPSVALAQVIIEQSSSLSFTFNKAMDAIKKDVASM